MWKYLLKIQSIKKRNPKYSFLFSFFLVAGGALQGLLLALDLHASYHVSGSLTNKPQTIKPFTWHSMTEVLPVCSIASTNLIRLGGAVSRCVNCLVKSRSGATETEEKKENFNQTSAYMLLNNS